MGGWVSLSLNPDGGREAFKRTVPAGVAVFPAVSGPFAGFKPRSDLLGSGIPAAAVTIAGSTASLYQFCVMRRVLIRGGAHIHGKIAMVAPPRFYLCVTSIGISRCGQRRGSNHGFPIELEAITLETPANSRGAWPEPRAHHLSGFHRQVSGCVQKELQPETIQAVRSDHRAERFREGVRS